MHVVAEGLADKVKDRLAKRLADARSERDKAAKRLENPKFVERAPVEVVAEERERTERFAREAAELEAQLAALGGD